MNETHDTAATLAIGDEIVLGQKRDTNTPWLAERLASLGVMRVEHATVPDERAAIADAVRRLARVAPLLLVVGGLGPTQDDLTREGLADALGEPLVEDADALRWIMRVMRERGRSLSSAIRRQAERPESATCVPNSIGTAPGVHAVFRPEGAAGRACDVFLLPGPPPELASMFEMHVQPRLRIPEHDAITTRVLHVFGRSESEAAEALGALLDRDRNPTVGVTASRATLALRVRWRGGRAEATRELDATEQAVRRALGPYVFGVGETTLASATLGLLVERRQRIVSVESCTGGKLGALLSESPGSSEAYLGGWVVYSNDMKSAEVDVPRDLLDRHGAVSEAVARAMAEGGLVGADADHAIAITGIAGPGGGTREKPVGTVYIARASREGVKVTSEVRRFRFPGDRADVRERSVVMALGMLLLYLRGADATTLSWQTPVAS